MTSVMPSGVIRNWLDRSDADRRRRPATYRVPEGTRVYAVGDIHGRVDLLERMHRKIVADAASSEAGRRVIVYLGDYVDRGPDSAAVIDLLLDHPLADFEAVYLKGNHEDFMLKFLDGNGEGLGWLFNGGDATLASYGIDDDCWRDLDPDGLHKIRDELIRSLPPRHRAFLEELALSHVEEGYLFVHAGIRPGVTVDQQSAEDLMWIREDFLLSSADHDHRVVHGHTITWSPEVRANRIGIDTGAFASGVLTCLAVEGEQIDFLTAEG